MRTLHWSFLLTATLIGCGDKDTAVDADGDGAFSEVDCDDGDAAVYPGAEELCDGIDNDCNEVIDDDATDGTTFYLDSDADGYGSGSATVLCDGTGYAESADDCNDQSAAAYPGAEELCDGLDNDCNGTIDDGKDLSTFYADADGDGYGTEKDTIAACAAPSGYVAVSGDCNDYNDELNPDTRWYPDNDGDGYGSLYDFVTSCEEPSDKKITYIDNNDDCDDDSAETYPGAVAEDKTLCMLDADGDGFGDNDPNPGVDAGTDCLDSDDRVYPGNVAEDLSLCMQDYDLDGYGDIDPDNEGVDAGTDCDDSDSATYPSAPEYCNNTDNDCNGTDDDDYAVDASTWYQDIDGDGFGDADLPSTIACDEPSGYTDNDEDCDDGSDDVNPDSLEDCTDSIDNDCDGSIDDVCMYSADSVDIIITGESSSDYLGAYGLNANGDLNGDGIDDLAVGAYYAGSSSNGSAYIFAGPLSGDMTAGTDSIATISGNSSSYAGYQVSTADVDGDGYDDLITSAYYQQNGSAYGAGGIFAFYGPITGDLNALDADISLYGSNNYDYYGYYVAEAYDYDSDGDDDIIGGSNYADDGMWYSSGIIAIHTAPTDGDDYSDASVQITGSGSYQYVGAAFDGPGDVDGDGYNDILFSAYGNSAAYLILGDGASGNYTSASADSTFTGSASDYTGTTLASGDFNNDGYIDLVIGSRYANSYAGATRYFYGPISGNYAVGTDYDAEITGNASEYFGYYDSQNTIADVDGDGNDDLLTASHYNSDIESYGGGAFLFYGALSGSLSLSDADVMLYGTDTYGYLGRGTAIGDLNDDGSLDIITGSSNAGSYAGEAYVLFNGSF